MIKAELIKRAAGRAGTTIPVAEKVINEMLHQMTVQLRLGDKIILRGFGNFVIQQHAEKKSRNPRTGEEVIIPARPRVKFKPASDLI